MAAGSKLSAGDLVGYPRHIFYMKMYFNDCIYHIQRWWVLFQWYSDLRGKLPVIYEKKVEIYNTEILPKLETIRDRLDDTISSYKPTFEGEHSFDPDELAFTMKLSRIVVDLDEVTAISRIIDKEKPDAGEEMTF